VRAEPRTPHLVRVSLGGPELEGFDPGLPAASVRLLLPRGDELEIPEWTGNLFVYADGTRATMRTLTPLRFDPDQLQLDVEIILHGDGPLSEWAAAAVPKAATAVSGPGRGYTIDPAMRTYVLAGDESALPAISTLLPALPPDASVTVLAEVAHTDAQVDLPSHPGADVHWHVRAADATPGDALVAAVRETEISPEARVWAAGEAASMQRIRKHLADDRDHPRAQCTVRGYWKHGRAGDDESQRL
jgi:NADPH-dependent ferric siderophore reductase